jgi:large subunit ribosomal protein L15
MDLGQLPKVNSQSKKRVGRGYGSGRGGHTSGRGHKGQRSRGSIGLFFEGMKARKSLLKRLPLMRGKGKLKSLKASSVVVNLKYLNLFEKDEEVTIASLQAKGILDQSLSTGAKVKILGEGEIKVPLVVSLPVSRGAREKIEKAGGQIVEKTEKPVATAIEGKPVKESKKKETAKKTKEEKAKTKAKSSEAQ